LGRRPGWNTEETIPAVDSVATGKRGLLVAHKISGLQPPILAVHPCTAGIAE
jgi:hypothetical protein